MSEEDTFKKLRQTPIYELDRIINGLDTNFAETVKSLYGFIEPVDYNLVTRHFQELVEAVCVECGWTVEEYMHTLIRD